MFGFFGREGAFRLDSFSSTVGFFARGSRSSLKRDEAFLAGHILAFAASSEPSFWAAASTSSGSWLCCSRFAASFTERESRSFGVEHAQLVGHGASRRGTCAQALHLAHPHRAAQLFHRLDELCGPPPARLPTGGARCTLALLLTSAYRRPPG